MTIHERAAAILRAARTGPRPSRLPQEVAPATLAEALAIQDLLVAGDDEPATAWKVAIQPDGSVARAPIAPSRIHAVGDDVVWRETCGPGLEPEIAFRIGRDVSREDGPFGRQDVAAFVEAHLVVELVATRFSVYADAPALDRTADLMSNAGLVVGPVWPGWREADPARLAVTLSVDGHVVAEAVGGHPNGDPLLPLTAFLNDRSAGEHVPAGTIVTTGSLAGLVWASCGIGVEAAFAGAGHVRFMVRPQADQYAGN